MAGVEYQVTKVDPTNPETKGMVYQVHKVSEEIAATLGGKVYRARIIKDPTEPTVAGKVYQIVLIDDPEDPAVKGKVYNAILTGGGEVVVIGPAVSPLALDDAVADTLTYVKAYGGTEQRNLPAGYTQLEYIGSTGTQYIDTGVFGPDVTAFELKGTIAASGGQNTQFIGGTNQAATSFCGARAMSSTITWYCMTAKGSSIGDPSHVCVITSTIESTSSQPGTLYDTETGTTTEYAKFASVSWGFGEENLLLFGGSETRRSPNATCYYLKLYTANGLAFYGIPVKNSSNAVGLYDLVSGTFFANSGTGDFVAGNAVVPVPTAPLDIISNNGALKARHQSGLPLGYTAVEYLQNGSSSCAINTGIAPTNTTRVEMKWSVSDTYSIYVFGSRPGGSTQVFTLSGSQSGGTVTAFANGYYKAANTDGVNWSRTSGIDNIFNSYFALNNGEAEYAVDDLVNDRHCDEFFTYTPWVSDIDTPLHLFSNGYNSQPGGAKIWYCKIYNGETLLMDLVPVIRSSDNVGGFYDKVGGGFYTTEQGGTYTGTPITDPVEIYADGTVETIKDTIGNTATTEMLLKVGDYTDVQSILDGVVTRNVGVKVLDGTEDWVQSSAKNDVYRLTETTAKREQMAIYATHFVGTSEADVNMPGNSIKLGSYAAIPDYGVIAIRLTDVTTLADFKTFLADQYAAGHPVIIVYTLATPTTETVTGQTLQVTNGDNTLEITQASIDDLELEAEYEKEAG